MEANSRMLKCEIFSVAKDFNNEFLNVFKIEDAFGIYSCVLSVKHDRAIEFLNKGIEILERLKQLVIAHKEATEKERQR